MKTCVITGNRKITDDDRFTIEMEVVGLCRRFDRIVFGGAIGTDTVALRAAIEYCVYSRAVPSINLSYPELVVVVPATLQKQPKDAQEVIEFGQQLHHVRLIEMGLEYNGENLKKRNVEMLRQADDVARSEVHAFWNGQRRSGTYSCMCNAKKMGLKVIEHKINGGDR